MRVLVIGRSGQLAASLAEQATRHADIELFICGRPEIDLEYPETVGRHFRAVRPDFVINAAAFTAVDMAESEPQRAFAINCEGAAELARAASQLKVPFVHISTDYVFDGLKPAPYVETDDTGPLNVYGHSKLAGERAVLASHPSALILRTSWVFSPYGKNFVRTMLNSGANKHVLRVVADQFGSPTCALDLASAILAIAGPLRDEPGGLYHLSGADSTNWYDFADFIFERSRHYGRPTPHLEPVGSTEYKAAACRPNNSRLDCSAFSHRFGLTLRPWQEAVEETVERCLNF